MTIDRLALKEQWLAQVLPNTLLEITALPGDASFRNYYRVNTPAHNYLLMDAPPALEDSQNFIAIANHYRERGIRVPMIYAKDTTLGFLLIEDFGSRLLSDALHATTADQLYRQCYAELPKIQACQKISEVTLLHFTDHLLLTELTNFKQWCLIQFCGLTLTPAEEQLLHKSFEQIKCVCAEQPKVGVHRDYHSRNLMILEDNAIGIIDFQDAVIGPITYDLVSLLRDCYVCWPEEQVHAWVCDYYETFADPMAYSLDQFQRWFDWQGLQRHLKAIFIFCRKYSRDGSQGYLADIPRGLTYVFAVTKRYPELADLHQFFTQKLAPVLLQKIETYMLMTSTGAPL